MPIMPGTFGATTGLTWLQKDRPHLLSVDRGMMQINVAAYATKVCESDGSHSTARPLVKSYALALTCDGVGRFSLRYSH